MNEPRNPNPTDSTTSKEKGEIEIFDYSDHREYLREVLKPFRGARSGMSIRGIARRAGIKSSATLTLIIKGDRVLTPQIALKLGKVLKLSGRRLRYFRALSKLSSSQSVEEQTQVKEELLRIKSFSQVAQLELKQYRFWSHWYYVGLYVLLGLEDWTWETKGLAKRMGSGVTPGQIDTALKDMVELDLVEIQNKRVVQKKGPILKSTEDVKNFALQRFHKETLDLAKESLSLPVEWREITCLTTSIPLRALPDIKEKVRRFREDLDQYIGGLKNHDEVFQFNFHLFPLTQIEPESEEKGSKEGVNQ